METLLTTPTSLLTLYRYPRQERDPLQAWDAADEYLINYLAPLVTGYMAKGTMIIMNDSFGALTTFFHQYRPYYVNDSYISTQGTLANLRLNERDPHDVTFLDSLAPLPTAPSLVIIKITKYQALLEHQLLALRDVVTPETKIIAAGKAKDIHASTLNLFEKLLGPTTTSLAWKKARLIFCNPARQQTPMASPFPTVWPLEDSDLIIHNHANVFSRTSLDIGARFMLKHLPTHSASHVIDLGCGNGVLGLSLLARDPNVHVTFIDESYMAVASAKLNVEVNLPHEVSRTQFIVNNALDGIATNFADCIVCNPPFHQQQAITDHIAWQMFRDAYRVLPPQGTLWVVGNRHLDYQMKLKKLFSNTQLIASNNKFVILKAIKRKKG